MDLKNQIFRSGSVIFMLCFVEYLLFMSLICEKSTHRFVSLVGTTVGSPAFRYRILSSVGCTSMQAHYLFLVSRSPFKFQTGLVLLS